MGVELLVDLLPSGQLGVCQSHAYSKYSKIDSHQVSWFCYGLHSVWCKNIDIHKTPYSICS